MPTLTPFSNIITFSRGSNATVVGPNGLVQWAPSNIHTFSEAFDNAAWSKTNAVIYPNQNLAGGTLGSQLATNGDFSAESTGWSPQAGWTISAGAASVNSAVAGSTYLRTTSPTVAGRWYMVTFTVTSYTSGALYATAGTAISAAAVSATGTYTQFVQANSTDGGGVYAAGSTTVATIDNVSVREITPAAGIAPDGTYTADTLLANVGVASTPRVADVSLTTVNGAVYTASIYVRPVSYTFFQLYINNQGSEWANFTLTGAGTATANGSCTAAIQALSDGWYRCAITYTAGGTDRRPFYMMAASDTATRAQAWNPNGSEAVLLWGAQLGLGPAATTYNPTTVKNLLGFSEAFDNAAWTKTRASIVTGAAANPINGLFNAQKLMEDTTASNSHFIVQPGTGIVANTRYVQSVYAKAGERSWLYMTEGNNVTAQAWFDIANGVVGNVTGTGSPAGSITAVGNGWYRCSLAFTPIAAAANVQLRVTTGNNVANYTGDGNSGIYIYGAQLSDSASLDPYVPTPGAAPSSTAYYGPRFDYDPVTLQPRGILIEEQRTNLLTYSEQFDNAAWSKLGGAITASAASAPDGTVAADQLVEDTSTGLHIVFRTIAFTSGTTYTLSFWVKRGTGTRNASARLDDGVSTRRSIINLATGAVTPASGHTVTTRAWGAYWYVTCTVTAVGTALAVVGVEMVDNVNPTYTGNGTSSIDIWGAQLEAGAFATSYIPTIASTVTRSADVATITGQNFGQWYRADEGCFVAEVTPSVASSSFRPFQASDGTDNERISTTAGAASHFIVTDGGVDQCDLDAGTFTAGTTGKLAVAYKLNDFAASLNGGAAATDTSGTIPTVDRLFIGARSSSVGFLNGHIRSIRYIPVRAADFQLQDRTK